MDTGFARNGVSSDGNEGTVGNVEKNTVHGSDAPETATFELGWFFRGSELPTS